MSAVDLKPGYHGQKSRKGIPNKTTADLKAMIEKALHDAGGAAYLAEQARANPSAFMALLGRILPKDIKLDTTGPITLRVITGTPEELGEPGSQPAEGGAHEQR